MSFTFPRLNSVNYVPSRRAHYISRARIRRLSESDVGRGRNSRDAGAIFALYSLRISHARRVYAHRDTPTISGEAV